MTGTFYLDINGHLDIFTNNTDTVTRIARTLLNGHSNIVHYSHNEGAIVLYSTRMNATPFYHRSVPLRTTGVCATHLQCDDGPSLPQGKDRSPHFLCARRHRKRSDSVATFIVYPHSQDPSSPTEALHKSSMKGRSSFRRVSLRFGHAIARTFNGGDFALRQVAAVVSDAIATVAAHGKRQTTD